MYEKIVTDALGKMQQLMSDLVGVAGELDEVSEELELREAQLLALIFAERDENGKKRYSNEDERRAQLTIAMSRDEQIHTLKKRYRELRERESVYRNGIKLQEWRLEMVKALAPIAKREVEQRDASREVQTDQRQVRDHDTPATRKRSWYRAR